MKRIFAFLLLTVTVFTLTACYTKEKLTINPCENCAFSFYSEESSKQYG